MTVLLAGLASIPGAAAEDVAECGFEFQGDGSGGSDPSSYGCTVPGVLEERDCGTTKADEAVCSTLPTVESAVEIVVWVLEDQGVCSRTTEPDGESVDCPGDGPLSVDTVKGKWKYYPDGSSKHKIKIVID